MKLKNNFKNVIVEVICMLYIFLFVYAAVSKVMEFENFQAQMGQSPVLGVYTGILSYIVIISEVFIALLLVIRKTRLFALYAAVGLMVMFTIYIIIILNFASNIPCSCGGVLENMDWKTHLIFNICFLLFGLYGIILESANLTKFTAVITTLVITESLIMMGLHLYSENVIHMENPFVRRFTPGSITKISDTKLHNNTLYFVGKDQNSIYIGDRRAPLHIFSYDSTLKLKQHFKIKMKEQNFRFLSVKVKIIAPYFFVMDGTIPIIYRGKISDWKADVLMKERGYYFSKPVIIDSAKIAFRTQDKKSGENNLGLFTFESGLKSKIFPDLLQKQIDGLFDTDGMTNYSTESKIFVYLYYYRNQFIVTDDRLQLKYRGNTIDTTTKAKLKPVFIKEKGERKLASTKHIVNRLSTIGGNNLFVNSPQLGKYESKEMWDIAAVVDVYNMSSNSYISSFYIYNLGSLKMKDMIVLDNNLYVIVGKNLERYKLDKDLKIQL